VLCTRETQTSITDSVHQLLKDQISALGLDGFYTVKEKTIEGINGSLFRFVGLRQQDVFKLKSFEGFDRCWVEEAQAVSKRSWSILIPTIRKPGSEIWISFNPELDSDSVYERFITNPPDNCLTAFLTYADNPWFPPELEAERLHLKAVDPIAYENVWEGKCRPAAEGAIYYGEVEQVLLDGRVKEITYDPNLLLHTVWDLGFNDSMAIIFVQTLQSEIRIIDYIENDHKALDWYIAEIKNREYNGRPVANWGTDYLPHDGASHSYQTGTTAKNILQDLGRKNVQIIPAQKVESGIKAARFIFAQCFFDENRTKRLFHCLKRYRRHIPTSTDEPGAPVHDEFSHGADAFRMLGLIASELDNKGNSMKPIQYSKKGIV